MKNPSRFTSLFLILFTLAALLVTMPLLGCKKDEFQPAGFGPDTCEHCGYPYTDTAHHLHLEECGHYLCIENGKVTYANNHELGSCKEHYICSPYINNHISMGCGSHYRCDEGVIALDHAACQVCDQPLCDGSEHGIGKCGDGCPGCRKALEEGENHAAACCEEEHYSCDGQAHDKLDCGHFACAEGDHTPGDCGNKDHFNCGSEKHGAASCKKEDHFLCDGEEHNRLDCNHFACEKGDHTPGDCKEDGHYNCGEQKHDKLKCDHFACSEGKHGALACDHFQCTGGEHKRLSCGHYSCDEDYGLLDCGHCTCVDADHTYCTHCKHYFCKSNNDHYVFPECGHLMCNDYVQEGHVFCDFCGECTSVGKHGAGVCESYQCHACGKDVNTQDGHKLTCGPDHYSCDGIDHGACNLCGEPGCSNAHFFLPCGHMTCGNATDPKHTELPCGHYTCTEKPDGLDHQNMHPCGKHYACNGEAEDHLHLSCGHDVCDTAYGYHDCGIHCECEEGRHYLCDVCGEYICTTDPSISHAPGLCGPEEETT